MSVVECRTRNRENRVRIPFATILKLWHIRFLHDAASTVLVPRIAWETVACS